MCCTKATLPSPAGRDVGARLQCYNQPNLTDVEAGVPWEHALQSLRDRAPGRPLAPMQANSIPASRRAGDGPAERKAKRRTVEELSETQGFAAAARYLLSDHRPEGGMRRAAVNIPGRPEARRCEVAPPVRASESCTLDDDSGLTAPGMKIRWCSGCWAAGNQLTPTEVRAPWSCLTISPRVSTLTHPPRRS
jgi:hypothetical protein